MALVTVEESDLAQIDTDLKTATFGIVDKLDTLEQELAAAGTPLPAGSLDAIKADVAALAGLATPLVPTPAPVDTPPPLDTPAPVDEPAPGDTPPATDVPTDAPAPVDTPPADAPVDPSVPPPA